MRFKIGDRVKYKNTKQRKSGEINGVVVEMCAVFRDCVVVKYTNSKFLHTNYYKLESGSKNQQLLFNFME